MNPFSFLSRFLRPKASKLDLRVRKIPGNQLVLKTSTDAVTMDTTGLLKLSVVPVKEQGSEGTFMLTGTYRNGTGLEARNLIELPDYESALRAHQLVYDTFSASWRTAARKGLKVAGIVLAVFVVLLLIPMPGPTSATPPTPPTSAIPAPAVVEAPSVPSDLNDNPMAAAPDFSGQAQGAAAPSASGRESAIALLQREAAAQAAQVAQVTQGAPAPVAQAPAATPSAPSVPNLRIPTHADIYSFDRKAIADSIPAPKLNCDTK